MKPPITTRPASVADLDTLVANVQAGFDSYVEFAPAGWRPRRVADDAEWITMLLEAEGTWALLALADEQPVGHVSFYPARARPPDDTRPITELPTIPGVAHLWQLFVLPAWWGRGVAPLLHDASVTEMNRRGFTQTRLYTPAGHLRARRFYERRGWSPVSDEFHPVLQLVLTEYTRALP
ncbi:MAG TPA: GNAT family N-acetyltransferase [Solirubrobacteraceae bacterium]|nr:GNAT family N-acetyltransferase [Solirubrobacteraceae bacterium]